MMNFTKKAGLATAIALVLSTSANATVFNAAASFRTIADITITEQLALSFGTAVTGKAGTACAIATTIADTTAFATETISGTGCATSTEASGEYVIAGVAGSTVTILMATATDTDFTFAPAGEFNDQEGTTDTITPYFSDSAFNVVLDGTNDGLLGVGGELSILNDLTASTSYTINYDISVVY
jgi:hypothetical protein